MELLNNLARLEFAKDAAIHAQALAIAEYDAGMEYSICLAVFDFAALVDATVAQKIHAIKYGNQGNIVAQTVDKKASTGI
jgi:hypothetical protein